jgi:hypothetical protein
MAKYPDRRSAALPALAAAQRCARLVLARGDRPGGAVMRLTPAYLVAVATFYDMFDTVPIGPAPRLRVHEHLVLAQRRPPALSTRSRPRSATTRRSTPRHFECLGASDIALVDRQRLRRAHLPRRGPRVVSNQIRKGTAPLPAKQLARPPQRRPERRVALRATGPAVDEGRTSRPVDPRTHRAGRPDRRAGPGGPEGMTLYRSSHGPRAPR